MYQLPVCRLVACSAALSALSVHLHDTAQLSGLAVSTFRSAADLLVFVI
jgi:hypothetical protein